MSQRNHRVDRFAQMTKQEEIIAKKRQEILEKQKTAQLAKAVAAAQNLAAQQKTETPTVKPIAHEEEEEEELQQQQQHDPAALDTSVATTGEEGNGLEVVPSEATATKGKADDAVAPKTLNSFTGKTGKITFGLKRQQLLQPSVEQPPAKVKNTFCNDGSFLENFKKILEKHEKPPPPILVAPVPRWVPTSHLTRTLTHLLIAVRRITMPWKHTPPRTAARSWRQPL